MHAHLSAALFTRRQLSLNYDAIKNISYDGMFFRNDIGYRAIKRES